MQSRRMLLSLPMGAMKIVSLALLLLVATGGRSYASSHAPNLPLAARPTLYIGDSTDTVYAVYADRGSTRWRVTLNGTHGFSSISDAPFAGFGGVYVGNDLVRPDTNFF